MKIEPKRESFSSMDQLKQWYIERGFFEDAVQRLDEFFVAKEAFLSDETNENMISLKLIFDDVYHDIKHAMHRRQLTEREFRLWTSMLKEGV